MVTRWTLIPLLALVACGERAPLATPANQPEPARVIGLASEAPATTRLIVGMGGTATWIDDFLSAFPDRGCADLHPLVDRFEAIAGDGWGPVLEIRGAITIADAACWLGLEPDADGTLEIGGDRLVAVDGALRMVFGTPPPAPTTPPPLAARYAALAAEHEVVLVANPGPATARVLFELVQDPVGTVSAVELPDEAVAREVERSTKVVFDSLAQLDPDFLMRPVTRTGARVEWAIRGSPLEDLLRDRIRGAHVEAFKVPSSSMAPTLVIGDHIFVLKGDLAAPPAHGDVIVFDVQGRSFIKRVIGVGGDVVAVDEHGLSVNGARLPSSDRVAGTVDDFDEMDGARDRRDVTFATERHGEHTYRIVVDDDPRSVGTWTVPADHVFVMGDFRGNSADSRHWGAVPLADVLGQVRLVWYSKGGGPVDWDRMFTPVR